MLVTALSAHAADKAPSRDGKHPAAAADGADSAMQVVEVTASKRKERVMDTPTSLTALSSRTLSNLGVASFTDYASLVPNLDQVGGQAAGQGAVVMRGMYTGPQQITNTTAFYLGETPFTASGAMSFGSFITPDPDLTEVARVEVLKGPQGTLYGASSLGGLVRIVPRQPDTRDFYGSARIGASSVSGGGTGYNGKVSVNVPAIPGLLGLQVDAFRRRDGGFVTNTFTGHDHLGGATAAGGGIAALLTPTPGLEVTLRLLSQRLRSDGPTYQDNLLGTGTPATGERQFTAFYDLPTDTRYHLAELTGQYALGPGTLTATYSHGHYRMDSNRDYTDAYGQLFSAGGVYCAARKLCAPAGYHAGAAYSPAMTKDTEEIRYASQRLGAFEFLAGGFHTSEDNDYGIKVLGTTTPGEPATAPYDNVATSDTVSGYAEEAVFGNLTWYLADAFDVGGGVRYARNRQDARIIRSGLLFGTPQDFRIASSDDSTTYQLTARWRATKSLSTYARIATGYRPGGPQTNPSPPAGAATFYDPDTVTNYELGAKGNALGGHLTYDAAIYHIDWRNVQLNTLYNGVVLTGNAGKATVNGVEAQATYSSPSGLSGGASIGYNHSRLAELGTTTASAMGAVVGDPLPGSPRLTAALYGDFRFVPFDATSVTLGATLRHQGEKPSSYSNTPLSPNYVVPAYGTLDLRAIVEWDRYRLRFGIDNATDRNGITGYNTVRVLASQPARSQAYLIRPRTASLTLDIRF